MKARFQDMIDSPQEKLPHLIFYGSAGTGKSTTARIIAKKLGSNTLILNSSDERGIQTVREKIKNFAQVSDDKIRIVLLEEIDGMTAEAQQSLRNLMETYSRGCRFIGTANFKHKIIEPLISRMVGVEFKQSDKEKIYARLVQICQKEGIQFDEDAIKDIINKCFPDIRKMINLIQLSCKERKITRQNLAFKSEIFDEIWKLIELKKIQEIRQILVDNNPDYNDLYKYIFEKIYSSNKEPQKKSKMLIIIAERIYKHNFCSDSEINFISGLYEIWNLY